MSSLSLSLSLFHLTRYLFPRYSATDLAISPFLFLHFNDDIHTDTHSHTHSHAHTRTHSYTHILIQTHTRTHPRTHTHTNTITADHLITASLRGNYRLVIDIVSEKFATAGPNDEDKVRHYHTSFSTSLMNLNQIYLFFIASALKTLSPCMVCCIHQWIFLCFKWSYLQCNTVRWDENTFSDRIGTIQARQIEYTSQSWEHGLCRVSFRFWIRTS